MTKHNDSLWLRIKLLISNLVSTARLAIQTVFAIPGRDCISLSIIIPLQKRMLILPRKLSSKLCTYNFYVLHSCSSLHFSCDTFVSLIIHAEQITSIFFSCFVMNKPQVFALITILFFIGFCSALPMEKFQGKQILTVTRNCILVLQHARHHPHVP